MYKNHVQSSILEKTYLGPARIIELSEKGVTIRDRKLDKVLSSKKKDTFTFLVKVFSSTETF
jgi:hypothetical protein